VTAWSALNTLTQSTTATAEREQKNIRPNNQNRKKTNAFLIKKSDDENSGKREFKRRAIVRCLQIETLKKVSFQNVSRQSWWF